MSGLELILIRSIWLLLSFGAPFGGRPRLDYQGCGPILRRAGEVVAGSKSSKRGHN